MKQQAAGMDDPRHLPLMEALVGGGNVSQRTLARELEIGLGGVHRLLRELQDAGHLEVVDDTVRPFAYRLTPSGEAYHRRLSHKHQTAVVQKFRRLQARIGRRLQEFKAAGMHRLVFYGAGRIMEVTLPLARDMGFEVVGLVDDDEEKQGRRRSGLEVRRPSAIAELAPCDVLITTFRHADEIASGLGGELPDGVRIFDL